MATIIQLRRDTAANWTANNPILADGEPALEKDTGKEKVGDGVTAWNDLPYKDSSTTSLYEGNVWRPEVKEEYTAQQNADLINAAITEATSVNGAVIIPAGVFNSRTWNWNPKVKLKGAGKRATTIISTAAEPLIQYTGDTYYANAEITDMTLQGGTDTNRIGTNALVLKRTSGFVFRNLHIEYFNSDAIECEGVLVGQFDDVHIVRCNGGIKGIKATTSSLGSLQSNLVTFRNCIFLRIPTWSVQWDKAALIQFLGGCDFEYCGTEGDLTTGVIKATNVAPNAEGVGIVLDGCWGEFNYGTIFSIQGNAAARHNIRNSMFQYGTASKAVELDGGKLIIENSTLAFPLTIINGEIETKSSTYGDITLQNASIHKKHDAENLTGTILNLGGKGTTYNFTTPLSATTYTFINKVEGGYVSCLIKAASEPTVTGANKIPGAVFQSNIDMEMVVEVKNATVRYFFLEL